MPPSSMRSSLAGAALILPLGGGANAGWALGGGGEAGRGGRRLDLAVGGGDNRGVVAGARANAGPGGVRLAQNHRRGAGVDQEIDIASGDPRLGLEVALAVAVQNETSAGRDRLPRLVGGGDRRGLRGRMHHGLIGVARKIATSQQHGGGEEQDLTHEPPN